MSENEEIQEVRFVIDDDTELRWPDGHAVNGWEELPGGGKIQLRRTERQQFALGGGVESWTLEMVDPSDLLHQHDMGEFLSGTIYVISPKGIEKIEPKAD